MKFSEFLESFSKFIGVEELIYFCEADIKQLGVRNSAHRARIVSSLVALRDKHERGMYSYARYGRFLVANNFIRCEASSD